MVLMKEKYLHLIAIFLILIFFILSISYSNRNSITIDEPAILSVGYYTLKTGKYNIEPNNPPLAKMIGALPLLLENPVLEVPSNIKSYQYNILSNFFIWNNFKNYLTFFKWARFSMLFFSLLLPIFLFLWGRELYGPEAGVFALILFILEPNMLSYSSLVTTDYTTASFIFISSYFVFKTLKRDSWKNILMAGISLGLALATKFTCLILYPLFFTAILLKSGFQMKEKKFFLKAIIVFLIIFVLSIITINLVYKFEGIFIPLSKMGLRSFPLSLLNSNLIGWVPSPFPLNYLKGIDLAFNMTTGETPVFVNGEWIESSSCWYYYFLVLLLKVQLPVIILFLLAGYTYLKDLRLKRNKPYEFLLILIPIGIFCYLSFLVKLHLSIRHILFVSPFGILFSSRLIAFTKGKTWAKIALLLTMGFMIYEIIFSFPHFLSYFNPIIGSSKNGYKYLGDSNVDWGQDLLELKKFMDKNKIEEIHLAYFGGVDPLLYGIKWKKPYYVTTRDRYFAISSNILQGSGIIYDNGIRFIPSGFFDKIKKYKIAGRAGNSIFIFDLNKPL